VILCLAPRVLRILWTLAAWLSAFFIAMFGVY
jgi:hypothetical protein